MIEFAGLSETGPVRDDNQDAIYIPDGSCPPGAGQIFAVADGMGGYAQGEVASSLALSSLLDTYTNIMFGKPDGVLKRGFEAANMAVCAEASRLGVTAMGTTLIAAAFHGNTLHLAHVGDSRAYLVRNGKATCLTEDHTVVGDLLRMKVIQAWQVRSHARRSILTKAVGMSLFIHPDFISISLLPGDRLVLCTDGCWSVVEDEELEQITKQAGSAADLCRALVDFALERGSDDNLSVAAAYVHQIPNLPQNGKARRGWMDRLFGQM